MTIDEATLPIDIKSDHSPKFMEAIENEVMRIKNTDFVVGDVPIDGDYFRYGLLINSYVAEKGDKLSTDFYAALASELLLKGNVRERISLAESIHFASFPKGTGPVYSPIPRPRDLTHV